MEKKSLWEIIKSAAVAEDGQGSSKRMASFYFIVILTSSLIGIEEYCYLLASQALAPTTIHMVVVKAHEPIIWSILITAMIYSGLTSVDKLIDFFKFLRGGNPDIKPVNETVTKTSHKEETNTTKTT